MTGRATRNHDQIIETTEHGTNVKAGYEADPDGGDVWAPRISSGAALWFWSILSIVVIGACFYFAVKAV